VAFVGSVTPSTPVAEAAERIRAALHLDLAERSGLLSSALPPLVEHAEELGVLVMMSGVVGADLNRRLDPAEFRGFSIRSPRGDWRLQPSEKSPSPSPPDAGRYDN